MNFNGSNSLALFKFLNKNKTCVFDAELVDYHHAQNVSLLDEYDILFYDALEPKRSRRNQLVIQTWYGFPIEASGLLCKEHMSKENRSYISSMIENVDFILSYSKMFDLFFNACFPLGSSKYVLTGMPRNDFLFCTKEEALMKLKKLTRVDFEGKRTILFYPSEKTSKESIIDVIEDILRTKLLERTNSMLLVKSEDILEDLFVFTGDNSISILNNRILRENMIDIYECLSAVDVLVTNYLPVAYDWLLTNRPLVYYTLRESSSSFLVEPLEDWIPGEIVANSEELIDSLEKFLMGVFTPNSKYVWLKNIIHYFQDGNSCERVLKFLRQYYGEEGG